MDVYCLRCNEPWESWFIQHDLWDELYELGYTELDIENFRKEGLTDRVRKEFKELGWEFGKSVLVIKRCCCCPDVLKETAEQQRRREGRMALADAAADLLEGDPDALQATLEDFKL